MVVEAVRQTFETVLQRPPDVAGLGAYAREVCLYVCVCRHVRVYVYTGTCAYMCIQACVRICVYWRVCVLVCVYRHVCLHEHVGMCAYMCSYMCSYLSLPPV